MKAAEQGSARAQYNIGEMIADNLERATAVSKTLMGDSTDIPYRSWVRTSQVTQEGREKIIKEAIHWYKKAAASGNNEDISERANEAIKKLESANLTVPRNLPEKGPGSKLYLKALAELKRVYGSTWIEKLPQDKQELINEKMESLESGEQIHDIVPSDDERRRYESMISTENDAKPTLQELQELRARTGKWPSSLPAKMVEA